MRPAARYPLDIVTGDAYRAPVRAALVVARGHGGFNSVVVVRAADSRRRTPLAGIWE